MWMYSGGDIAVFLVLVRTLNIPAVLIATVVLLVPWLLFVATMVLLTDWKARDWAKGWLADHRWIAPGVPVVALIILYTGSWPIALGALVIGLLVGIYLFVRRFWNWGHQHISRLLVAPRGDQNGPNSLITVVTIVIVFLITPANMWLPLERIEMASGEQEVGYVLEATSDWTTLITVARRVDVLPTPEVKGRTICRTSSLPSIATLLFPVDLGDSPSCK